MASADRRGARRRRRSAMKRALAVVTTTCLFGATNSFVLDATTAAARRATIAAARCEGRAHFPLQARVNEEAAAAGGGGGGGGADALGRQLRKMAARAAAASLLASSLLLAGAVGPAWAENELSAKYGGGLDTSLVDQTCLVDRCGTQAKACLADDPSCRKGLTCTAKCLGDNACITGCMARYGDQNLDNLLKCTIEDHECIKVAILPGGADEPGQEPRSPAPTVRNFDPASLRGSWYKVVGYNPNYDCYACQRNSFSAPVGNAVAMDVEFSMPHLLPDGSPPPPTSVRELIQTGYDQKTVFGSQSIGLNDYSTRETMVFDSYAPGSNQGKNRLVLHKGTDDEASYARTAHSEGEMFGLKFWENWYIIGENDPGSPDEFKFVAYNGKTRQNTYEGAFVYSRTKDLSQESMMKVYKIAREAGMNPDQFCRIRNGCFADETVIRERESGLGSPSNPFRGILASTKVSEFFGVEPVAARDTIRRRVPPAKELMPPQEEAQRSWWYEVGDYLENPHRHFRAMDELRIPMDWPEDVKNQP